MSRFKTVSILVVGALAIATIFGAVAYRAVSADAVTTRSAAALAAAGDASDFARQGPGRGERGVYASEDLAAALGITVDELNTAYQTANNAAIDQALEQGLITQAQADALKERSSTFPIGKHWGGLVGETDIDYEALLAEALGITQEELQAAYTKAFDARIDQAVADGNMTAEEADLVRGERALYADSTFRSAMQSAFETAVAQAVQAGVITQAQADLILERLSSSQDGFFGGPGMRMPDMGMPGMRGHH